ncbi:MAG: flippase-like domain-containing protein [Thermoleophilia bacterium]|nr:flippase-like domain-containing protein [Thermoleophilia bacterium]
MLVVLAALGLAGTDLGAAADALTGADPELVALAALLYGLGQTASGWMWAVCQRAGGVVGLPLHQALGMHWMARGACELLPASLGEAVRLGVVRRHPAGARAGGLRIAGGIAGYKVLDAAVTGAAVLAAAIAVPLPGPAAGLRWTAIGAVGVLTALALAWRLGAGRLIARLLPDRARRGAAGLADGASVLVRPREARQAAALGAAAVALRVASLGALLAALDATPAAAMLAFSAIVLAGVLPATPGGAGAREAVLVPALAVAHGIPTATALAFSVAVQIVALATTLLVALPALAWLGPGLRRGERDAAPAPVPAG